MGKVLNFLNTVFVEGFWKTFCVKWVWQTFLCAWVYTAFWKTFVVKKLKFDKWKGWIYLSPAIVLLLIFTIWPIFNTVNMAFMNGYTASGKISGDYVVTYGIENFKMAVKELTGFPLALKNTLLLTFVTVPLSTVLALLIAVCLNAIKPLQRFLQTIFFLPYVTNSIAIGMVFAALFATVGEWGNYGTSYGLINSVLGWFGVDPINFIGNNSGYWANFWVLVIYIVWNALPFKILVLLGALQSINKQYYEAAKIDGTPRWRVFTRITVPLLSPMIAYVVITGFIGGFKEYSSIVGVFGSQGTTIGGPTDKATMRPRWLTMVGYIYQYVAQDKYGMVSAAALILFAIIFVVTMINLYVSKKKTHY